MARLFQGDESHLSYRIEPYCSLKPNNTSSSENFLQYHRCHNIRSIRLIGLIDLDLRTIDVRKKIKSILIIGWIENITYILLIVEMYMLTFYI